MSTEADRSDGDAFAAFGALLADAVAAALGPWVRDRIERACVAQGRPFDETARVAADEAALDAVADVIPPLRELLSRPAAGQTTTPLTVIRRAVHPTTRAMAALGLASVARDDFALRAFPEDVYGLSPAGFADLGIDVHEAGIRWGAAKAFVMTRGRSSSGNTP